MIAELIALVLRNAPVFLFIAALAMAAATGGAAPPPTASWRGSCCCRWASRACGRRSFHFFFPAIAAADIGWEVSPFQFEVGMADLAIGATACVSFWRNLDFKAAAVLVEFDLSSRRRGRSREPDDGRGDFAPGNAGVPFYSDVALPVLMIVLLIIAQRSRADHANVLNAAQKHDDVSQRRAERDEATASLIASSR